MVMPGRRSYNYQTRIKPWFEPYLLRKLPRFKAIVCHCEKPFRKRLLPPITPEGITRIGSRASVLIMPCANGGAGNPKPLSLS